MGRLGVKKTPKIDTPAYRTPKNTPLEYVYAQLKKLNGSPGCGTIEDVLAVFSNLRTAIW